MRAFWSFIGNDHYDIGCTGQTVYLYEKQGTEFARFKDLPYAYLNAKHELDVWMTSHGQQGLLKLLEKLNDGADFNTTYGS